MCSQAQVDFEALAFQHVSILQTNFALAQENARLAQENALFRMRRMAPATMQGASLSKPIGAYAPGYWGASHKNGTTSSVRNVAQDSSCELPPPPGLGGLNANGGLGEPAKIHLRPGMQDRLQLSRSSVSLTLPTETPASNTSSRSSLTSGESPSTDEKEAEHVLDATPPQKTTVIMQKLPVVFSRSMLADLLDSEGFKASYDFIYMPIGFKSLVAVGYAFINFISSEEALRFQTTFQGFSQWPVESENICEVKWSETQGLLAHIERYRSSPLMHEDVPDECKPALFASGERTSFPPSLKPIRAPRIRRNQLL